jgi:carbon storage regulator
LKVGDEIEIRVLEINGEQVRLGISAPVSVRVLRKELYTDIHHQNVQAASVQSLESLHQVKPGQVKGEDR